MKTSYLFIFCLILMATSLTTCTDFCAKNPDVLFCSRESPCSLDPECKETSKEIIGFGPDESFMRKIIVRDINDLRKEMAQGQVDLDGQTFPSAGDMVEIEWHFSLESAAQNYVRHCTTEHSDISMRILENMTEVSEYLHMMFNTQKMSDEKFWEESLKEWKKVELTKMKPYVSSGKAYDPKEFVLILFGKQRYVGCGWLSFHEDTQDVWTRFVVCQFAPAGLENSMFYAQNKKACTVCPKKTDCAKKGSNKGVLCAWSGAFGNAASSSSVLVIFAIYSVVLSIFSK